MPTMTETRTPHRSLEQRQQALDLANEIRSSRARLKERVRSRELDAAALLREPPADTATMKVFDLLLAVPGLGRTKVNTILTRERISPTKTLGGLSDRQRTVLTLALRSRPQSRWS